MVAVHCTGAAWRRSGGLGVLLPGSGMGIREALDGASIPVFCGAGGLQNHIEEFGGRSGDSELSGVVTHDERKMERWKKGQLGARFRDGSDSQ